MLTQQVPYPALVVDRLWNLVMLNQPARRLMAWLLGLPPGQPLPVEGVNVVRLMLDPHGIRPCLPNWQAVCADLLHWVQREAMADGPGSETRPGCWSRCWPCPACGRRRRRQSRQPRPAVMSVALARTRPSWPVHRTSPQHGHAARRHRA